MKKSEEIGQTDIQEHRKKTERKIGRKGRKKGRKGKGKSSYTQTSTFRTNVNQI
jgi:hypothetical protein